MLNLDSPRWGELQHAYGPATDTPDLLRQLRSLPDSHDESEPWFTLWSSLAHQGDVYSASFAAVPHVVSVLASAPEAAPFVYFQFPAWVEVCRLKSGTEIPPDLEAPYRSALAQLPGLVSAASSRPWDTDFLASALSAIAASKGNGAVAEAVLELAGGGAEEFRKWWSER